MGIRSTVSRSTLSEANEKRDWRIYADFAQILIHEAKRLYINEPFGVDIDETVYALDSTTIDLCLSLFPWAQFRKQKGAIKMHTLLKSVVKNLFLMSTKKVLAFLFKIPYLIINK